MRRLNLMIGMMLIISFITPLSFIGCNSDDDEITIAPKVDSVTPSDGSYNVSCESRITATFSLKLLESTINSETFVISSGGNEVPGSVSYKDMTATFTPDKSMNSNTIYTARITTGIKGIIGKHMSRDYSWTFTTAGNNKTKLFAGAGERKITPGYFETYQDLNGNKKFDGEINNPNGTEPFDDANGNGILDTFWLAGGHGWRAVNNVRDDLYATAVVFNDRARTVAIVGADLEGISLELKDMIRDRLKAQGVNPDLLIVNSSNTHGGLNPMGQAETKEPGEFAVMKDKAEYYDYFTVQAADAVKEAYENMTDADLTLVSAQTPLEQGNSLQFDNRDPNIIDNSMSLMRFDRSDGSGTIATVVNWGSRPEMLMHDNVMTAGYPGEMRKQLKEHYKGSICVFLQGASGGRISSEDTEFTYDGIMYPDHHPGETLKGGSEAKMAALGSYLADIAVKAIDSNGKLQDDCTITDARSAEMFLPLDNPVEQIINYLNLNMFRNIYDSDGTLVKGDSVDSDQTVCHIKLLEQNMGTTTVSISYPDGTSLEKEIPLYQMFYKSEAAYLKIGEMELLTNPGEVHPELLIGCYDGSCRNPDFPLISQDNPTPELIGEAPDGPYWKDYMTASFKFFTGLTNDSVGCVYPPHDFALNPDVKWIYRWMENSEWTRHHYEETSGIGPRTWRIIDYAYRDLLKLPVGGTLSESLQNVTDTYRKAKNITGMSAAVITPDTKWLGTSGISYPGQDITADMVFNIASSTKTFTAAIILQLAEEGVLTLDDTVQDWLPDIQQHLSDPGNIDMNITVHQLLSNTSGTGGFDQSNAAPEDIEKPEDILKFIDSPVFEPGTAWGYSNTNFIILGMIIKKATGENLLSTVLQNRIFNPLGLTNTFLAVEQEVPEECELVHPWVDTDGLFGIEGDGTDALDDALALYHMFYSYWLFGWADGAIFSTAEETGVFIKALFEERIVSREYIDIMTTTVPTPPDTGFEYGLGILKVTPFFSGRTLWGHGGVLPWTRSAMFYSPEDKTAIVVQTNHFSWADSLVDELLKVVVEQDQF